MKWRVKQKPIIPLGKTRSKKCFAWFPIITNDHYKVWLSYYRQDEIWKYEWIKTNKWTN